MKRAKLIIIILFTSIVCNAQKYYTRSGVTEFKASEKAFEPVEAINNSTTAIFNINTGEVVAQVFIASFEFKNALMQEHFNENYMESTSYPKAVFKGKIDNFSKDKLKTIRHWLDKKECRRGVTSWNKEILREQLWYHTENKYFCKQLCSL